MRCYCRLPQRRMRGCCHQRCSRCQCSGGTEHLLLLLLELCCWRGAAAACQPCCCYSHSPALAAAAAAAQQWLLLLLLPSMAPAIPAQAEDCCRCYVLGAHAGALCHADLKGTAGAA